MIKERLSDVIFYFVVIYIGLYGLNFGLWFLYNFFKYKVLGKEYKEPENISLPGYIIMGGSFFMALAIITIFLYGGFNI